MLGQWKGLFIGLTVSVCLTACDSQSSVSPNGSQSGVPHLESYCTVPGLSAPLRQTVLVIDEQSVTRAEQPEQIRTANPALFQLVTTLGDPQLSLQVGSMAPRERLTIYVAPQDGGALKLAFTGCVPGFSVDEKRSLEHVQSAASKMSDSFFSKGPVQQAGREGDTFRTALLGALVNVASMAPGAKPAAPLMQRSFLQSLQSVPQLSSIENGVPRVFLFTDVAGFAPDGLADAQAARRQGFADADKARLLFGMADVHVVGPRAPSDNLAHDYAQAFFLGSQGHLLSWGGAVFTSLPPAPTRLDTFTGNVSYPPYQFPMQMRLAADRNGSLVDSWVVVKKERSIATPLTGSISCDADQVCQITTDQGGFSQVWAPAVGPDPHFAADLPFGGLRQLSANLRGNTMTGKVFDPAVGQIGSVQNTAFLPFTLTRAQ
jgi:hypothetical protein